MHISPNVKNVGEVGDCGKDLDVEIVVWNRTETFKRMCVLTPRVSLKEKLSKLISWWGR
jgi:hypothetical protein